MSDFFASRDAALNRDGLKRLEPIRDDHCPLLCQAMQGKYDAENKCYVGQPYTLTVWMEGPLVKFCLGAGDNFPKFFSSFSGLDSGFESIEKILQSGGGNWVEPKPPKLR